MASFIKNTWNTVYDKLRLGKIYSAGKSGVMYLSGLIFGATIASLFVGVPLALANDLERGTLMNIIGTLYGIKVVGPNGAAPDPYRLPTQGMQGGMPPM